MSRAATEYRYEKLTWPDINDAIDLGKVCDPVRKFLATAWFREGQSTKFREAFASRKRTHA